METIGASEAGEFGAPCAPCAPVVCSKAGIVSATSGKG